MASICLVLNVFVKGGHTPAHAVVVIWSPVWILSTEGSSGM